MPGFRHLFVGALISLPAGLAQAQDVLTLPMDEPMIVSGIDVVCTGIGLEAQEDPRWLSYPVRVEVSGRNNEYLADFRLTLEGTGGIPTLDVRCAGAWLLLDLPEGRYPAVIAAEGTNAAPKRVMIEAPASGQRRAVIQFPEASAY
ncbi:MAG: hypothetical protein HXY22_01870 [Alphaproteobacteria bacterium]|nr:hypothetical protein [Alphaproteobacteria bacterium]